MKRPTLLFPVILLTSLFMVTTLYAQRTPTVPRGQKKSQGNKQQKKYKPLPSDKRLLSLHLDFVKKAEKLAAEYERDKSWDKALDVYQEIVKLVPQYPNARNKIKLLRQQLANANKTTLDIRGDRGWQPTGIKLSAGKPITIRAAGSWTFRLSSQLGPEGMKIPKELRDFNLGCLIGAIDSGSREEFAPFVIGKETSFLPKHTGQLYLRMYDTNPSDNEGSLKVEVSGSFQQKKKM